MIDDDKLGAYLDAFVEEEHARDDAEAEAAFARFEEERAEVEVAPLSGRRAAALVVAVTTLAAGLVGLWSVSGRLLQPEVATERGDQAADVSDDDAPQQAPRHAPAVARPAQQQGSPPAVLSPKAEAVAPSKVHSPRRKARPSEHAEPPAPTVPPDTAAEPSALARELESLKAQRRAVRGRDYGEALTLVASHRRHFAAPTMAAERDLIELEALCGLGRIEDVKRAKAGFAKNHPLHHLRAKAEGTCKKLSGAAQNETPRRHQGE
ncbi:MAG: hypothetical protein ACRBN8_01255 [Nannocystales bacterium]